jgi:ribosomal protein S18 acetylase RimI-like enzyme
LVSRAPPNRPLGRPPTLVVRPARQNDVSKLSAFFVEAWREAGPGALGFAGANDEAIREIASEEFLRKRLATPTIQMMVAEEGGKVIGFSSVRRVDQRQAELSGIVVLERATGRGVGSRLLRKSLEGARKRGFNTIIAKTEVANERAIRFYRGAGFTESGKTVGRVGGTSVELRIMAKRLR